MSDPSSLDLTEADCDALVAVMQAEMRIWREIFPKTDTEVVVSRLPCIGWSGSGGYIRAGHAAAVFTHNYPVALNGRFLKRERPVSGSANANSRPLCVGRNYA